MRNIQKIFALLAHEDVVEMMIQWMAENLVDFPQEQRQYQNAMQILSKAQGDVLEPCIEDEKEAIRAQISARVFFSGFLGIRDNLMHFMNPTAKNFLDSDYENLLQEAKVKYLPEYKRAQTIRDRFNSRLTVDERGIYDSVISYTCYLETVCPKLAHYCGYLLGNEIFADLVPGYVSDTVQTLQYTRCLENYLGVDLDRVELAIPQVSF